MEVLGHSRSVMPLDALGRTRHTIEKKESLFQDERDFISFILWILETEY
jgi:hypothetical protein